MEKIVLSVGIVAFNEQEYIGTLLEEVLEQDYPKDQTEILLIDSMSTDDTLQIFKTFQKEHCEEYKKIQVLQNTGKIQASGWNVAIKSFIGDALLRIDAHARLTPNFLTENANTLLGGEYVCGGMRPNIIQNETRQKRLVHLSDTSMFGGSFGKYHQSEGKKYVDTVFHGCYRREVLEKVGYFNEDLGRTEDNDFHYRIRKEGYKICYNPKICSYQFSRPTVAGSLKQKYGNGYWIGRTLFIQRGCISLFHLVPFCFIMALISSILLALFASELPFALLILMYLFVDFALSAISIISAKKFYLEYLLLPIMFPLLHISYGIGTLIGILSILFKRSKN